MQNNEDKPSDRSEPNQLVAPDTSAEQGLLPAVKVKNQRSVMFEGEVTEIAIDQKRSIEELPDASIEQSTMIIRSQPSKRSNQETGSDQLPKLQVAKGLADAITRQNAKSALRRTETYYDNLRYKHKKQRLLDRHRHKQNFGLRQVDESEESGSTSSDSEDEQQAYDPEEQRQRIKQLSVMNCFKGGSQTYVRDIVHDTPIDDHDSDSRGLYTVVQSRISSADQSYCPILLKIVNTEIMDKEQEQVEGKQIKYLLQVWGKSGQCHYERKLQTKPLGWGIFEDLFCYQVADEDQETGNVKQVIIIKLFEDKQAKLMTVDMSLSQAAQNALSNQKGLPQMRQQKTGLQCHIQDTELMAKVHRTMKATGELHQDGDQECEDEQEGSQQTKWQKFKSSFTRKKISQVKPGFIDEIRTISQDLDNLIQTTKVSKDEKERRALQNPNMAFLTKRHLLFAVQNAIVEIILPKDPAMAADGEKLECQFKTLRIDEIYQFKGFVDIGLSKVCMLLENVKTHQVRFFKPYHSEKEELRFEMLGRRQEVTKFNDSPIKKYATICSSLRDSDLSRGKKNAGDDYYMVCLVLRDNGRVEVYSDFMLTSEFDMIPSKLYCTDITYDLQYFYLKYLNLKHKEDQSDDEEQFMRDDEIADKTGQEAKEDLNLSQSAREEKEPKYIYRKVASKWRSQIQFNKTEELSADNMHWTSLSHNKIKNHFSLYNDFLAFSKYILVAHRSYISIFDCTLNNGRGDWTKNMFKLDSGQFIREMVIQKRQAKVKKLENPTKLWFHATKQKGFFSRYRVCVFHGINKIEQLRLSRSGELYKEKEEIEHDRPILSIQQDAKYKTGTILVCAQGPMTKNQLASDNNRDPLLHSQLHSFNSFEIESLKQEHQTGMKVFNYNYGEVHELKFASNEVIDCDSELKVVKINRTEHQELLDTLDPNEEESSGKMSALIVRTRSGLFKYPYPKDHITKKCEVSIAQRKELQSAQLFEGQRLVNILFQAGKEALNDREEWYMIVTDQNIYIFDNEDQLRYKYEGLNLKSAVTVDQAFMYSISSGDQKEVTKITYDPQIAEDGNFDELEKVDEETIPIDTGSSFVSINISMLFEGQLNILKLYDAIGGLNTQIEKSWTQPRILFLHNFSQIALAPIPNENLVSPIGMASKMDYYIWRRSPQGFFTALNMKGRLVTWSTATGQIVHTRKIKKFEVGSEIDIESYAVYRSDKDDMTYTKNWYSRDNLKQSIQLLVSRKQIDKSKSIDHVSQEIRDEFIRQDSDLTQADRFALPKDLFRRVNDENSKIAVASRSKGTQDQGNFPTQQQSSQRQEVPQLYEQAFKKDKLFHFKVLKLTITDKKTQESKIELAYHFFHQLLAPRELPDGKVQIPKQRLYLSIDLSGRMLEVIDDKLAIIYTRNTGRRREVKILDPSDDSDYFEDDEEQDQGETAQGSLVKWQFAYTISNFPYHAAQVSSFPYFLTPDFRYMFGFNYTNNNLRIIKTRNMEVVKELSQDIISIPDNQGVDEIQEMFSKVIWRSNTLCDIFDDRRNLKLLHEFKRPKKVDGQVGKCELTLLSAVQDQCYDNYKAWAGYHRYTDMKPLDKSSVLQRLMRVSQHHTSEINYRLSTQDEAMDESSAYDRIQNIDYDQDWDKTKSYFDIEQSFTWVDWMQAEKFFEKGSGTSFHSLVQEEKVRLMVNIFHHGDSLLKMLTTRLSEEAKSKQLGVETCVHMFKAAEEGTKLLVDDELENVSIRIGLIQDVFGLNPIDYAMGHCPTTLDKKVFVDITEKFQHEVENRRNVFLASQMFQSFASHPFLALGNSLVSVINKSIGEEVPDVTKFLDARLIKGNFISANVNYPILGQVSQFDDAVGDYGAIQAKAFESEKVLQEEMFQKPKDQDSILQPMDYTYFDLPQLFDHSQEGFDLMNALNQVTDLDTFEKRSIQILISQHWNFWRMPNFWMIGVPLFLQLFIFSLWSNVLLINSVKAGESAIIASEVATVVLALYSLMLNIKSAISRKAFDYIVFVQVATPILIFTAVIQRADQGLIDLKDTFWDLVAWASLLLWFQFLLFLRSNNSMGPIVGMVLKNLSGMMTFVIVFLLGVFAFADSFKSVHMSIIADGKRERQYNSEQVESFSDWIKLWFGEFIAGFRTSYYTALGGFDPEELSTYSNGQWIIFVMSSLFNIVLLLNLLIAIVSNIFDKVKEREIATIYQQLVRQVCYCQSTLSFIWKPKQIEDNNLLLFIAQLKTQKEPEQDRNRYLKKIISLVRDLEEKVDENTGLTREVRINADQASQSQKASHGQGIKGTTDEAKLIKRLSVEPSPSKQSSVPQTLQLQVKSLNSSPDKAKNSQSVQQ